MTKLHLIVFLIFILLLAAGAQFAMAHGPGHNPLRHNYVKRHGVPKAYSKLRNPLRMTAGNLSTGQRFYDENCTICHGPTGRGDGEGSADLKPAPPRLTEMYSHAGPDGRLTRGVIRDHPGMTLAKVMGGLNLNAYTFWSISEGGKPMGGSMPAFKDILSEKERWQILLFIANGFSTDDGR